jgi:hypothetical protein
VNDVDIEAGQRERAKIRKIASAAVVTGGLLLAAFTVAVDIADRRHSDFFEEGAAWILGRWIELGILEITIAAVVLLIITPTHDRERRAARWRRAGWSLVGVVAWVVVMRLVRAVIVGPVRVSG